MNNYYNPQQGYYNQGMPQMYAPLPSAKMTQVLSKEEMNELRQNSSAFNLMIEPIEFKRAVCTHKNNGQITLLDVDGAGRVQCEICQEEFTLVNLDQDQVREIVDSFLSVLQTIKTYYLDIPEDYVQRLFKMIPLVKKVPGLYQIALSNWQKYNKDDGLMQGNNPYGFNALNMITGGMFGGNMMGMGYPQQQYPQQPQYVQQPQYGQPQFQQPQYNAQPQYQNGGMSPFMMGAPLPQQGMQPQQQYQPAPGNYQPQQPVQGGGNPQGATVTSEQKITTTKTFKD